MNDNDMKGYGCVVFIATFVSILFSCAALLRWDNWECEISPAGFVIGVLSALITFLVGWQIWQTITSREEIREMRDNARTLEVTNQTLIGAIERSRHTCEGLRWFIDGRTEQANTTDFHAPINSYRSYLFALRHYVLAFEDDLDHITDTLNGLGACVGNAMSNADSARMFVREDANFESNYAEILGLMSNAGDALQNSRERLIEINRMRQQLSASQIANNPNN